MQVRSLSFPIPYKPRSFIQAANPGVNQTPVLDTTSILFSPNVHMYIRQISVGQAAAINTDGTDHMVFANNTYRFQVTPGDSLAFTPVSGNAGGSIWISKDL